MKLRNTIHLLAVSAIFLILVVLAPAVTNAATTATTLPLSSIVKIYAGYSQSGSGVVIDKTNGYILTNAHVVLSSDTYTNWDNYDICTIAAATDEANCQFSAKLLYADADKDLALLKVSGPNSQNPNATFNLPSVDIQNISTPTIGSTIHILGFPGLGGNTITASDGIISGFEDYPADGGITVSTIKTDGNLISGVSGGLAIDTNGSFVGIPSSYLTYGANEKIGLIISADEIKKWFNSIISSISQTSTSAPVIKKVYPADVSGLNVKKLSDTSVELNWNQPVCNSGISFYELTYDSKELFKEKVTSLTDNPNYTKTSDNKTSYVVSGLKSDQTYYFSVAADDSDGNSSSDWSNSVSMNMTTGIQNDRIFADVGNADVNAIAIKYLRDRDIISGYPDSTFRPNNTINRAELVKMIVSGQGITVDSQYSNCFKDVTNEWFAPYVCYAKQKGWISGYDDNTFRPGNEVNYVEALKIVLGAYNLPFDKSNTTDVLTAQNINQWYSKYLALAADLQLLPDKITAFSADEHISRAKLAEVLYRTIKLKNYSDDYSSDQWKDSSGNVIDSKSYFSLNGGTYKYKRTNDDKTTSEYTRVIKSGCAVYRADNCYTITSNNTSYEVVPAGSSIFSVDTTVLQDGTNILYTNPELIFSNKNALAYYRSSKPWEIKDGTFSMNLKDGIDQFKQLGTEKIDTVLGQLDTIKIQNNSIGYGDLTVGDQSMPILIYVENVDYYAKDVGAIKGTVISTAYSLNSGSSMWSNSYTYELESYTK